MYADNELDATRIITIASWISFTNIFFDVCLPARLFVRVLLCICGARVRQRFVLLVIDVDIYYEGGRKHRSFSHNTRILYCNVLVYKSFSLLLYVYWLDAIYMSTQLGDHCIDYFYFSILNNQSVYYIYIEYPICASSSQPRSKCITNSCISWNGLF